MLNENATTTTRLRAQGRSTFTDRDAPVICPCGRTIKRAARQQKHCSARCREKARRRTRKAGLGGYTGAPANPPKSANKINEVRGAKSVPIPPVFGPARIIAAELFAGEWDPAVSADGVKTFVRRRAAVGGRP